MHTHKILLRAQLTAALALGALCLAAVLPAGPAWAADKKQNVSNEMAKPLKAAQDALNAKKYPEAINKLKDAEANSKKTPYDQHVINLLLGAAYFNSKDYANASKAFEAQIEDGFLDPGEVASRIKTVAQLNYQLKDYDKAIEYGNRSLKGNNFSDAEMVTLVGQAYYLKNDFKGTLKFEDAYIKSQIDRGETPKNESLQLALSSCVKLQDADCTTRELERLVAYYPKTEYWQQLLYTMFQGGQQSDPNTLQLFRLMDEVDVLKRPEDYTEMAQLAIEQGSPGEAQHVLEKATGKGVFTDARSQDKNKRLLDSAKKAAAADQASLPKVTAEADASATGAKNVGVGLAYLGYQQYDKAIDQINKGLTKGGLKNEAEARLLLGIAQLRGGHKEDATKSFKAVKGDAFLERLANLWNLHAKQA
jgi:tetratricopeptide (TPR) repeat protein